MKNRRILSRLAWGLSLLLCLPLLFVGCGDAESEPETLPELVGRWRMTAFVTDDGNTADVQENLDIVFYETCLGEMQYNYTTYYLFEYSAGNGKLTRTITRNETVTTLEETYAFGNDYQTLTIHTPGNGESDPAATITLVRIKE